VSIEERSEKEVHSQGGFNESLDCNLLNNEAKGTMKNLLEEV
jgi:hypothetical protein